MPNGARPGQSTKRRAPRRRSRKLATLVAGALITLGAASGLAGQVYSRHTVGLTGADEGCTAAFPARVPLTRSTGTDRAALDSFAACANRAGTATQLINRSLATWVVDVPLAASFPQPTRSVNASFLNLIGSPSIVLPPNSRTVVLRPPTGLRWKVDARLTVAQLLHNQILETFGTRDSSLMAAAFRPEPSSARRALVECVRKTVEVVEDWAGVLRIQNVAGALSVSAQVAGTESSCGRMWLAAQFDAAVEPNSVGSFGADAEHWLSHPTFVQGSSAAARIFQAASAVEPYLSVSER